MNENADFSNEDTSDGAGTPTVHRDTSPAAESVMGTEFIERVRVAYLSLLRTGRAPTQRAIRHEMRIEGGGGSPNWIKLALHDRRDTWDAEAQAEPGDLAVDIIVAARKLSPGLVAALEKQFSKRDAKNSDRLTRLAQRYRDEMEVVEETNNHLRDIIANQQIVANQQQQQLEACTAAFASLTSHMTDQIQSALSMMQTLHQQMEEKIDSANKHTSDVRASVESLETAMNAVYVRIESSATQEGLSEIIDQVNSCVESLDATWNHKFKTIETKQQAERFTHQKRSLQIERSVARIDTILTLWQRNISRS